MVSHATRFQASLTEFCVCFVGWPESQVGPKDLLLEYKSSPQVSQTEIVLHNNGLVSCFLGRAQTKNPNKDWCKPTEPSQDVETTPGHRLWRWAGVVPTSLGRQVSFPGRCCDIFKCVFVNVIILSLSEVGDTFPQKQNLSFYARATGVSSSMRSRLFVKWTILTSFFIFFENVNLFFFFWSMRKSQDKIVNIHSSCLGQFIQIK